MINQKLQDFEEEVKPIGDVMTHATIEMYEAVVSKFLPTPTKIHYLFNLRDISRVRYKFIPLRFVALVLKLNNDVLNVITYSKTLKTISFTERYQI